MSENSDNAPLELRARVTREIPLWGILTVLAMVAAQAISVYYGQQAQEREMKRWGERLTELAADTKSIVSEAQKSSRDQQEQAFSLRVLQDRVRTLEQQMARK